MLCRPVGACMVGTSAFVGENPYANLYRPVGALGQVVYKCPYFFFMFGFHRIRFDILLAYLNF